MALKEAQLDEFVRGHCREGLIQALESGEYVCPAGAAEDRHRKSVEFSKDPEVLVLDEATSRG